jgi:hypothetical protein
VANTEISQRRKASPPQGRHITVGNMSDTVAAIGDGASVIYNQALSSADHARAMENYAQEKLAGSVARLANDLLTLAKAAPRKASSPYKYLLPFEFADAWRFFGRETHLNRLLDSLTCGDSRCRLAILHGDAGMGKTSLLRAGIAPELVAAGHLPLQVRVTGKSLATNIKQRLVQDLHALPMLQDMPLSEFMRRTADMLPAGKGVFILIDQFEVFFEFPEEDRQRFVEELAQCLFTDGGRDHWLLSIGSSKVGHLSTFEPVIPQPLANTVVLPPLSREEAREAILEPARIQEIEVDRDLLKQLLPDLGGDFIDPSRLQLVCHTLAEGLAPGERQLTTAAYEKLGGQEGILRDHLALVLERNLTPRDREAGWQLLATLHENRKGLPTEKLVEDLRAYGIPPGNTQHLLETLQSNRLIRLTDEHYHLTSESLRAPIRQWADERAAIEQARMEAKRQFGQVRSSALRGFFGGGLGAVLAYFAAFSSQTFDRSLLPYFIGFEFLPGAIAGIVFIFAVDLGMASFRGPQRRWRLFWGLIAGAIAFPPAFMFHTFLGYVARPDALFGALLSAAAEGAGWGAAVGLGTMWAMSSKRSPWLTIPIVALTSGIILTMLVSVLPSITGSVGGSFRRPGITVGDSNLLWLVFLAGTQNALAVVGAALWGMAAGKES